MDEDSRGTVVSNRRSASGEDVTVRCPLCESTSARCVSSYSYEEIWARLREVHQATFSTDVINRHTPAAETLLFECARCGLQYFTPSTAGEADFYRELMSRIGYEQDRWEFQLVANRLDGAASVIDFGCGDGDFLRLVRASDDGIRVVGVDHNPDAIARLRAAGIEGYVEDAIEHSQHLAGGFDVVCIFQTLEHVNEPRSLLESAATLLSPSGRMFVSVPNRHRIRGAVEARDCPPHHLTRWDTRPFEHVTGALGLRITEILRQAPRLWDLRRPHAITAEQSLGWMGPRPAWLTSRIYGRIRLPKWWYDVQVRRGAYATRELFGHTMLVEMRRVAHGAVEERSGEALVDVEGPR